MSRFGITKARQPVLRYRHSPPGVDQFRNPKLFNNEKQLIKQLYKQNAQDWTKAQIKHAVFLLNKHVEPGCKTDLYNLVELHKKLLPLAPQACFEIGEKLLDLMTAPSTVPMSKIGVFKNNCYAYIWNYMRLEIEKENTDLVKFCFLALRFSLAHTILNLDNVVSKLQQSIVVIHSLNSVEILETAWGKLIETIKSSLSLEFENGKKMPPAQVTSMEDNLAQLVLVLTRQMTIFPNYTGLNSLYKSIRSAAGDYVPMIKVDLAISYSCKSDANNCLEMLARQLDEHRPLLRSQSGIYDVFEIKTPWNNWNQQWVFLKKDNPELEMITVFDILKMDKMDATYKAFLCRALKCEINAYFCWKIVLADSLICAGEALETHALNLVDSALGSLAKGVGFWCGGEEFEKNALESCQNSIKLLNRAAKITTDNPTVLIISGLAYAWVGICHLRGLQTRAGCELTEFMVDDMIKNPSRYKGMEEEDTSRVIPGLSTLTLKDEFLPCTWLKKSVDTLFKLINFENEVKRYLKESCPSLILITMRFIGHLLTAMGDSISSIKAWRVLYTVSNWLDNRISRLFSGAELIRQVPNLDSKLVSEIEKSFKEVWKMNESILRSTRPYLWRLDVAKSTQALHTKNYQQGLAHLAPLLEFRVERDNFDISHHIMADTYYLLAQYRAVDASRKIDFSGVPQYLRDVSSIGLATKAFKHIAGMARAPNFRVSGWADVLHNSFLLSSMMQMAPGVTLMLQASGKIRDMRVFAADCIYLAQQMGFVTRTIEMLIPLAEADMLATTYDSCELKIIALEKMFGDKIVINEKSVPFHRANILETWSKRGISGDYKRIINVPDNVFSFDSINMPEYHYGKGDRNEEKAEMKIPIVYKMRTPPFLFHSLKCSCYLCSHPLVIPLAVQYLQLLASYAIPSKNSASANLLESASRHHLRGMFRILHHFPALMTSFAVFTAKAARSILEQIYQPFFFGPMSKSLLYRMELASPEKIEHIVNTHNLYQEVCNMNDANDHITKQKSFEILGSALFLFLFDSKTLDIRDSNVRDILKTALEKNRPAYPDAHSPELPSESVERICPPGPAKKGIRINANGDVSNHFTP